MKSWQRFLSWLMGKCKKQAAESAFTFTETEQIPIEALAYLGDAVYELFVRTALIRRGILRGEQLHREATKRVNAPAQAEMLRHLAGNLTDVEKDIVRRGRNTKSGRIPKNAQVFEYRYSTALEALIGYLFVKENWERLEQILGPLEKV
jgi:ribonuclease-3 family protein